VNNETLLILAVVGVGGYLLYTSKPRLATYTGPTAASLAAAGTQPSSTMPRDKSEAQIWSEFASSLAATGASIYKTYESSND
jgi:hypothetical protein